MEVALITSLSWLYTKSWTRTWMEIPWIWMCWTNFITFCLLPGQSTRLFSWNFVVWNPPGATVVLVVYGAHLCWLETKPLAGQQVIFDFSFSIRILIIYLVESERIWIATKRGERAIARVLQGLWIGTVNSYSSSLFHWGQGEQSPTRSLGGLATALLQLAASYLVAMAASFALQTWRYGPKTARIFFWSDWTFDWLEPSKFWFSGNWPTVFIDYQAWLSSCQELLT